MSATSAAWAKARHLEDTSSDVTESKCPLQDKGQCSTSVEMAHTTGRLFAILAGLAALFAPTPGRAQPVGAFDRLSPAPAGDDFFSIASADVPGALRPSLSLAWSYARDPLALRAAGASEQEIAWVEHQVVMHALMSVEVARRIKLELDAPFTLSQDGVSGALGGVSAVARDGGGVNDLRFGARVALLRQSGAWPAVGLALSAFAPTGDEASFQGSGAFRYAPAVLVGASYPRFVWSTSFSRLFIAGSSNERLIGSQVQLGAAAAARFGPLQVGPEVSLSFASGDQVAPFVAATLSGEALLAARYALGPFRFGLGGGPGIGRAPGTPSLRFFASIGYVADFGGRVGRGARGDERDVAGATAPGAKGSAGQGSSGKGAGVAVARPAPDRDGDTVPDAEDACPSLVGEAQVGAKKRGCPSDRDDDGIFDIDDRCPDEAGVLSADAAKSGCPADRDGDGIPDGKDACPDEKGKASEDAKKNGCPTSVRVEGAQIVILQQVHFKTGDAEIESDSFDLLEQVAALINDHPEIARVAVDGHTDNVGVEQANLSLSRRRALSVMSWLVEHGVDARRLEARGFGPRRPIADNKTTEGRAKNRRVEFLIRKKTDEGEAGWVDGPIE